MGPRIKHARVRDVPRALPGEPRCLSLVRCRVRRAQWRRLAGIIGLAALAVCDFEARFRTVPSILRRAAGPYEAPRRITTRWLRALANGQREFVIRGDGKNLIDFMYVDDAVDGFLALVKTPGTKLTVDFASGAPVSVNDIVKTMGATLGVDVVIRNEGAVAEYIQFHSVDTTMRDRFGVEPSIAFADGLQRLSAFLAA